VPPLDGDACERVLELLGYHADFGDPERIIRLSEGTVAGPKGIFFAPLEEGETVDPEILRMWLTRLGIDRQAVTAAIRKAQDRP